MTLLDAVIAVQASPTGSGYRYSTFSKNLCNNYRVEVAWNISLQPVSMNVPKTIPKENFRNEFLNLSNLFHHQFNFDSCWCFTCRISTATTQTSGSDISSYEWTSETLRSSLLCTCRRKTSQDVRTEGRSWQVKISHIFDLINSGATSIAYLAVHKKTKEKFCVKVVNKAAFSKNEKALQQVIAEVDLLQKLNHPNIVKAYGSFDTDEGFMYIILEL